MATQAEQIINASIEGRKVARQGSMADGSPAVGGGEIFDPKEGAGQSNVACPQNLQVQIASGKVKIPPNGHWAKGGTIYFNPKREDPEVEAILGEKKYQPRIEPDSPDEIIKKNEDLEGRVNELTAKLDTLVTALGKKEQPSDGYDDMTIAVLRKEAARRNINVHDYPKKVDLIGQLRKQDKETGE